MCAVVIGSGGDQSADLDSAFAGHGVEADQVHRDVFEHGEVVRGMAAARAHLVVSEDDIHAPVQAVLDGPVRADRVGGALGLGAQARDVITLFDTGLASDGALGLDDNKRTEIRPLRGAMQALELIEAIAASVLESAMILFDAFVESVGGGGRGSPEGVEEIADRFGQLGVVVLYRQHVISLLLADHLGNIGLRAHCIDRHDAALKRQALQQQGYGRLLVRLLCGCALSEHEARAGREGADQVQRTRIDLARAPTGLAVDGDHRIGSQCR